MHKHIQSTRNRCLISGSHCVEYEGHSFWDIVSLK